LRALRIAFGVLAAAAMATATFVLAEGTRARHLAVPVLAATRTVRGAGEPLAPDGPPCAVRTLAELDGRVTAIARDIGGTLYVGTFDRGLYRVAPGEATARAGQLVGRELFIDTLFLRGSGVLVGTHGGLVRLDARGRRAATHLPRAAVSALVELRGRVIAATSGGLLDVDSGELLTLVGPAGETPHPSAAAVARGRLWLGTPEGVYSLALAQLERCGGVLAVAWHPLVFGAPGADSNVVTALVPTADGVLAATDDSGVVLLRPADVPRGRRFELARANDINPGAAAIVGTGAALGTAGAGILLPQPDGRYGRPHRWPAADVSAVHAVGDDLLIGTDDGRVLLARCPTRFGPASAPLASPPSAPPRVTAPSVRARPPRAQAPRPRRADHRA
jgi:hypothetical protein